MVVNEDNFVIDLNSPFGPDASEGVPDPVGVTASYPSE